MKLAALRVDANCSCTRAELRLSRDGWLFCVDCGGLPTRAQIEAAFARFRREDYARAEEMEL